MQEKGGGRHGLTIESRDGVAGVREELACVCGLMEVRSNIVSP